MKFSIITAAYNASATIRDTIVSVASQDWPEFEHLVIDGLSTDGTQRVVEELAHSRLRLISERDQGCYDAMNKGLTQATGDVVVFVNADDFLASDNVLNRVAQAFEASGAQCVIGQTVVVDQCDTRKVKRVYAGHSFRPWMLRFGHMPPHPSFYATRETLIQAKGFDLRYRISADFDLMVRLFHAGVSWTGLPDTLSVFREGGLSTRNLAAKRQINREISQSLRANGLFSARPLLWARYPFKAAQLFRRAYDYSSPLTARPVRQESVAIARDLQFRDL